MASNSFGQHFRITTFGESHGPAIGVVIDGCPSNLALSVSDLCEALELRRPGKTPYVSPRKEEDMPEILSGVFDGKTTGAPITILIRNQDAKSEAYESLKHLYRPGHANYTYLEKYGIFDYRGGGRASARETVARVAAGAVAKKLLKQHQMQCTAYLLEMGPVACSKVDFDHLKTSPIFCPCPDSEKDILKNLETIKSEGDSFGGIVEVVAQIPPGLGDPIYLKLEALLAFAMLSIPASKGFEIGQGFQSARMKGSEHNDLFALSDEGQLHLKTNSAGGTLGGISTGETLCFRVAFKPTSSIRKAQQTVSLNQKIETMQLPPNSRHDPCVAIRAVPVVEAMASLVIVDAMLANGIACFCKIK